VNGMVGASWTVIGLASRAIRSPPPMRLTTENVQAHAEPTTSKLTIGFATFRRGEPSGFGALIGTRRWPLRRPIDLNDAPTWDFRQSLRLCTDDNRRTPTATYAIARVDKPLTSGMQRGPSRRAESASDLLLLGGGSSLRPSGSDCRPDELLDTPIELCPASA
jgi:hypothetical protein